MANGGERAAVGEGADHRLPRLGHAHNGRGMGRRLRTAALVDLLVFNAIHNANNDLPLLYFDAESFRFETMPSRPSLQAWA